METITSVLKALAQKNISIVVTQKDPNSSIFVSIQCQERDTDPDVVAKQIDTLYSILPLLSELQLKFTDKSGKTHYVDLNERTLRLHQATKRQGPMGTFISPTQFLLAISPNALQFELVPKNSVI